MRTIIAGSREIIDYQECLDAVVDSDFEITEVISGGARGADKLGELFAKNNGLPLKVFPADWETHGKPAGYIRNQQMANNADALIALWDGISRGTKHMIEIANSKGLHVHIHYVRTLNTLLKGS